jgi:Pyrimidine dimer DNA glycosylase
MNIFYLSHKPSRCARWHCDKHVVKMILETAQLLYTAHWVLESLDMSTAPVKKGTTQRGYQSIKNKKHPSAIWARESLDHYRWLCALGAELCREYKHRYGQHKEHACQKHIAWLSANPPASLKAIGWRQPPQAMPEEYQNGSSIAAYRAYYIGGKKNLLHYTKRHTPHWI